MLRFILKRLGLALITLLLLSVIVFFLGQVLPSDPGRSILGPLAAPSAVRVLDHQLGVDRPILTQYWHWITNFPGKSYQYQAPIGPILTSALGRSLKLAIFAFVIVVPLGIIGGVISALNAGKPIDRTISVVGLSLTVPGVRVGDRPDPGVRGRARVLPVTATAPPGSGFFTQIKYLILPAIPLVMVLFGYIARMARAGTIEALDVRLHAHGHSQGAAARTVIRRHVLRNSLLPTIAVIATQMGYLIGGLVVVEKLFNYNGIGQRISTRPTSRTSRCSRACVLVIGVVYLVATLVADILYSLLNPRIRRGGRMSTSHPGRGADALAAGRARDARRCESCCARRRSSSARSFCSGGSSARSSARRSRRTTRTQNLERDQRRRSSAHLFGTDQLGRDMFSRVLAGARNILTIAPLATRSRPCAARPSASSPATSAGWSTTSSAGSSRRSWRSR